MLNLFFFADFGCFGVELSQNNGAQFFCPLKSQKKRGGADPTFASFLHRFQLHCILYRSGRNKTGPLLGVFICFYC